jgi:hypothetical protein
MATGNGSTTLRRYRLRTDKNRWLADIVISDDGYFSTVSDYGNYAFWWGAAGDCFRSFLADLNSGYLCSKLGGARQYYDGDATEKAIRRHICEYRRHGWMTKEEAREEWETLKDYPVDCREGFAIWYHETKMSDAYEFAVFTHEPQLIHFTRAVWPVFARALRDELAAEKAAA